MFPASLPSLLLRDGPQTTTAVKSLGSESRNAHPDLVCCKKGACFQPASEGIERNPPQVQWSPPPSSNTLRVRVKHFDDDL